MVVGQAGFTSDHFSAVKMAASLFQRGIGGESVVLAHHDSQGVGADTEFDRLTANGLAGFDLGILDGATGIGDVGLAGDTEALEVGAGADTVNG